MRACAYKSLKMSTKPQLENLDQTSAIIGAIALVRPGIDQHQVTILKSQSHIAMVKSQQQD